MFRELGHQRGVAHQLESLAWCATRQSRDEQAVALASATAAMRQRIAAPPKPTERDRIARALAQARERISHEMYQNAWNQGHAAPLDRLLEGARSWRTGELVSWWYGTQRQPVLIEAACCL